MVDLLILLARSLVMAELPAEKRVVAVVLVLFSFVAIAVPSVGEIMDARGCTTFVNASGLFNWLPR